MIVFHTARNKTNKQRQADNKQLPCLSVSSNLAGYQQGAKN